MAASDPSLKRWLNEYNRRYFAGKIPRDVRVYWEPADGNLGDAGQKDGQWTIRIDPCLRFSSRMAKMALLHELCHVAHPGCGHGPVFQKAMMRLAKQGAFAALW